MVKDKSIFDSIVAEIFELLKTSGDIIEKKEMFVPKTKTSKKTKTTLYIVNQSFISQLLVFKKRLEMEYPQNPKLHLREILKVINFNEPSHIYKIYRKDSHKSITKPETVYKKLKAERAVAEGKLKNLSKKISKKRISIEAKKELQAKLQKEIEETIVSLKFLLDNFDNLDVRISSYLRKSRGYAINYSLHDKTRMHTRLSTEIPNIFWFKELDSDLPKRTDDKQKEYFKKATHAFGDVYYLPKED